MCAMRACNIFHSFARKEDGRKGKRRASEKKSECVQASFSHLRAKPTAASSTTARRLAAAAHCTCSCVTHGLLSLKNGCCSRETRSGTSSQPFGSLPLPPQLLPGKAAIADYFWEHVFQASRTPRDNGLWFEGKGQYIVQRSCTPTA